MGMKEEKPSNNRRPFIFYYCMVMLVMLVINLFLMPSMQRKSVQEVPYSTFRDMVEEGSIVQVARNEQQLTFLARTGQKNILGEDEIKWYIEEAIRLEKSGEKVPMKTTETYHMPEELKNKLEASPALKEAFNHLTPGRQRQYMYYIGNAKKASTRQNRVEKYIEHILEGKGMNDD